MVICITQYLFSWHKISEHFINVALLNSAWTLLCTQLEDTKSAWEKITKFSSFYLVLQSKNITIMLSKVTYIDRKKTFSYKSFFHWCWMPLNLDTFDNQKFFSSSVHTSYSCYLFYRNLVIKTYHPFNAPQCEISFLYRQLNREHWIDDTRLTVNMFKWFIDNIIH